MTDKTQPEALRLAEQYDYGDPVAHSNTWKAAVCTELRRQHARIAEMEAQLEAVGAGGVSGPLMGQPQAMPDLSALTERGARAWAGVDAQGLRDGVASAGSGPVAWVDERALAWLANSRSLSATITTKLEKGKSFERPMPIYLHPSPPDGMVGVWTALPGALPEPGVPVLLDIGKKYPIRALWAAKHTVEAADDDTDWAEYDEATETYYCPEGWYEWNEHEEIHWAVRTTPCAWAPLPPTTPAGSGKGE